MPFQKGKSGNPKGKPVGTKAKITPEAQAFAKSVLEQADYRKRVSEQAIAGTLHPKIESMLWAYAYGAPQKEESNQSGITVNLGFLQLPEPNQAHKLNEPQTAWDPGDPRAIEVKVMTDGKD